MGLALLLYILRLLVWFAILWFVFISQTKWGDGLYNTVTFWFDREWRRVSQPLKLRVQYIWYRRKAGRCLKCGYDLLHNTSGICPECGTPIDRDRCTGA